MVRTEIDASELDIRAFAGSAGKEPHVTLTISEGDTTIVARVPRAMFDEQVERFAADRLDALKEGITAELAEEFKLLQEAVDGVKMRAGQVGHHARKVLAQRVRRARGEAPTEAAPQTEPLAPTP